MAYKPDPAMTAADAAARHRDLMADKGWAARFLKGGADERAELRYLQHLLAGVPHAPAPPGREQAITRKVELEADPAFVGKYLAGDVDAQREWRALNDTIVAAES